jgi:hypothetical protein
VYVLPLYERINLRMYRSTIHHKIAFETNEYSFILVTILKMSAVFTGPLKQNQRLASRPQADAVAKSLCKGGSWASEARASDQRGMFTARWFLLHLPLEGGGRPRSGREGVTAVLQARRRD